MHNRDASAQLNQIATSRDHGGGANPASARERASSGHDHANAYAQPSGQAHRDHVYDAGHRVGGDERG